MSMAALRWARALRGITSTQKLVLLALADMANDHDECWPSTAALADDCCMSERAARYALAELEARGVIAGQHGRGRATRWCLKIGTTPAPRADVAAPHAAPTAPRATQAPRAATSASGAYPPRHHVPEPRHHVPIEPSITPSTTLKNPKGVQGVVAEFLPEWLPEDSWRDWCHFRRGKTWTPKAVELSLRKLAELRGAGDDPRAVIEQSIANGWRGLFPIRQDRQRAREPESRLAWMLNPGAPA